MAPEGPAEPARSPALTSQMRREAGEAPQTVAGLLDSDSDLYETLASRWRAQRPAVMLTVGRGSSGHAALYLAYLAMTRLSCPVASLPPSVVTMYGAPLQVAGQWCLSFSQSGRSPDLVESAAALRAQGAWTVAVVNDTDSPLGRACDTVLPVHAGPERSVAATKSCLGQMAVAARLVAACGGDAGLAAALSRLPDALVRATEVDWDAAVPVLAGAERLYVIGRGAGLAVAQEAALKLKETCDLPAEAFSGAEVEHGPKALVGPGFTVLVFAPPGAAQAGLLQTAAAMRQRGARVLLAAPAGMPGAELPIEITDHDDLDPLSMLQSFYLLAESVAQARGQDPDAPRHLAKVTHTR